MWVIIIIPRSGKTKIEGNRKHKKTLFEKIRKVKKNPKNAKQF